MNPSLLLAALAWVTHPGAAPEEASDHERVAQADDDIDEDLLDEELDGEWSGDDEAETEPDPPAITSPSAIQLTQPLTFNAPSPAGRVAGRVGLGPPGFASVVGQMEYGLSPRLAVGGEVGTENGDVLLRATGRYALVSNRFESFYVTAGGSAGAFLGTASYPELRAELAAGKRFAERVDVQATAAAVLALGGGNPSFGPAFVRDVEYVFAGQAAYLVNNKISAIIESNTRLEPTELSFEAPEGTGSTQIFSSIILGGRYRLREDLSVGAGVRIPIYHRYRWDYYWGAGVAATWLL